MAAATGALTLHARRAGSRHAVALAATWLIVTLLLAFGWSRSRPLPPEELERRVGEGFDRLWTQLEEDARRAAEGVGDPDGLRGRRLEIFERLAAFGTDGVGLVLLDPDREALAWAGPGLLHEPEDLPLRGGGSGPRVDFWMAHGAATLFAVHPLAPGPRPWLLVAGRSVSTETLPFSVGRAPRGLRWALAPAVRAREPGAETAIPTGRADRPAIELLTAAASADRPSESGSAMLGRRLALLSVVLAVAVAGARFPVPTPDRLLDVPTVAGAALAAGAVEGLPLRIGAMCAAGFAAPFLARALEGERSWSSRWRPETAGVVTTIGAAGVLFLAAGSAAWPAVHDAVLGPPATNALRLAIAGLVLGAWWGGIPRPGGGGRREVGSALVLAVGFLAVAAALHDLASAAAPALAAGGWAVGRWWGRRQNVGAREVLVLALLAAVAGGIAWESGRRLAVRSSLVRLLPQLDPPSAVELARVEAELIRFFEEEDLRPVLDLDHPRVDGRDLALDLWKRSPLPRRDGLSALVVEPVVGDRSSFAFGFSLDADLALVPDPERWQVPPTREWREGGVAGEVALVSEGATWGHARFWWLARPGFRLEVSEIEELEAALVRGRPQRAGVDGLPSEVSFALYDATSGTALLSPWEEAPPIDPTTAAAGRTWLRTPDGRSWWTSRAGPAGLGVLFLPVLGPSRALERIGVLAVGTALAGGILLLAVVAFSRDRGDLVARLRDLGRSYSGRLLIVYTGLLLVPLVALNLVLLQTFEQRLRTAQLDEGKRALATARQYLVDFLVRQEPGFGLDTLLDVRRLEELSDIVQHQVNLYWGGRVQASSQQELFTSGLLPRRIPGEIFARITLLGFRVATRTQDRREPAYSELYAPLQLPGASPESSSGLFLSVPLLAQETEVSGELARLRRRAGLVTTVLFLLLLGAGSRLARRFTQPLQELIAGTRRIAAGADRTGVVPRDTELIALAGAIDEMAGRIATQRGELVREKELVEGIVENITSAVVSLDRDGRVLLQNRAASALLGGRPGEPLANALGRRDGLEAITDLMASSPDAMARTSLRLPGQGGDTLEWSVVWIPFHGEVGPASLLVVEDATDILRAERLEAWAEMARIIAHEIKNPLTPIRLSADHLRQVRRTSPERLDAVFDRCIDNILDQVEELREISSEFSVFSRIPETVLDDERLDALVGELVDEYAVGAYGDRIVWGRDSNGSLALRADRRLLRRALRNVLENALRASAPDGVVEIRLEGRGDTVLARFLDRGPGVRPELLGRIFEPYFSTSEGGTGLGLAITRKIVEEHAGTIEARNREGGGLEILLTLPAGGAR